MLSQIVSDDFFAVAVCFGRVYGINAIIPSEIKDCNNLIPLHLYVLVGNSVFHTELGSANGKFFYFMVDNLGSP